MYPHRRIDSKKPPIFEKISSVLQRCWSHHWNRTSTLLLLQAIRFEWPWHVMVSSHAMPCHGIHGHSNRMALACDEWPHVMAFDSTTWMMHVACFDAFGSHLLLLAELALHGCRVLQVVSRQERFVVACYMIVWCTASPLVHVLAVEHVAYVACRTIVWWACHRLLSLACSRCTMHLLLRVRFYSH